MDQQVYELSQRHAARLLPAPRMTLRYEHHRERHEALSTSAGTGRQQSKVRLSAPDDPVAA